MRVEVEYEELGAWTRELLLNGCGPNSIEWVPELIFQPACNRHDFDYIVGGPRDMPGGDSSWRLEAEIRFKRNLYALAWEEASWWSWPWYRWLAWSYYKTTLNLGRNFFVYREFDAVVTKQMLIDEENERQREAGGALPSAMARCVQLKHDAVA